MIQTVGRIAAVVVPILVTLLLARLVFTVNWPWPDWNLPRIPFPDLPDLSLPGWGREVPDKAKYVWPIVLAYVLAKTEINRRRKQDELRAKTRDQAREQQDDA